MTQTAKKPEKTRIREEDWSSYVDAVHRDGPRGCGEEQTKKQKEIEK